MQEEYLPWLAFKRPLVRDLAYAIACPPVLLQIPNELIVKTPEHLELPATNFWQRQFQQYMPRLQELEQNPQPLNRFFGKTLSSFRLGFRFEALLLFWLLDESYHCYQLVAHNIQLFDGKITHGELDFIVKNKETLAIEHWEVAVKFFLGEYPYSPAFWKGLKGTDNLFKKTQHMLTKPFSQNHVMVKGRSYPIDKRVLVIKGRFYEPQHELATLKSTSLPWLNPMLPRGKWYNSIPTETSEGWRNARRVEWLTKRECYDAFDLGYHCKQTTKDQRKPLSRRHELIWKTGLFFSHCDNNDIQHENAVMLRLPESR